MNNQPNPIDPLINKATKYLHEMKSILSRLLQMATDDGDFSTEDKILTIQLLLQYRLGNEDALSLLLKIDHNLLFCLGIQPQQSAKMNLDRLTYAVGNEDLKQILRVLATLAASLSKMIARYKSNHASFTLKQKKTPVQSRVLTEVLKLSAQQNQFLDVLHKLDLEIKQLIELQAVGPLFDHIAALRGPISQFYEAIMHGLELAEELYFQLKITPSLDYQLHSVLKKTEAVLDSMVSILSSVEKSPSSVAI